MYKAILPPFFVIFFESKVEKGLFNFDFQVHKTRLKRFVFEILFIGDYSSTFHLYDDIV